MDNEIKRQRYRKLSVAALVAGMLVFFIGGLYNFLWMLIADFMQKYVDAGMLPYIVLPIIGVVIFLAIAAVVCGSIDLKKIKTGINSRKGKGFDIAGIVLGGLFILMAI